MMRLIRLLMGTGDDEPSALASAALAPNHASMTMASPRKRWVPMLRNMVEWRVIRSTMAAPITVNGLISGMPSPRPYGKTDLGFARLADYADPVTFQRRAAYKGGRSCLTLRLSWRSISTPHR